jgi:ABC-2 type transport system permease protein
MREAHVQLSCALRAEWTKLRTVTSTAWLLLAAVTSMVAVSAAAAQSVGTSLCPSPTECHEDIAKLSLTGIWVGQAAVVVLGVLAVSNEYGTRMIRSSLIAVPRRRAVLVAKAAVVTGLVLAAGVMGVLGSVLAGRLILPGNGFTPANGYALLSLGDGPTLRAAAGTVLYLGLVALLSLGVAAIVRDTAGAITSVLGLLYLAPVFSELVAEPEWHSRLKRYGPMEAGLSIQATTNLDRLEITPWAGLGVFALYAGIALLVGLTCIETRDAF